MNPNIARNSSLNTRFRRANSHDAVVVLRGQDDRGNDFVLMEKVNHPIAVFPRNKPAVTVIPVEDTKFYRGTQRQYEQRGMILNAPMKMRGRRDVYHFARMRKQQAEAILRKSMGVHHPTAAQVEMYYAGASHEEIRRRTLVVSLH